MKTLIAKIASFLPTYLHVVFFIALLLIVSNFLGACTDKCEVKNVYSYYEPVYTSLDEIRSSVDNEAPRVLQNLGKLYLKNNYLFINEPGEGLHVINNQDPSNPENINFVSIPGNYSLSAKGNYMYVDSFIDLVVLDISNPINIVEVARVKNIFNDYNSYGFYVDPQLGVVTDWKLVENIEINDIDCDQYSPYNDYAKGYLMIDNGIAMNAEVAFDMSVPSNSNGIGGSLANFTIYDNFLYTIDQSDLTLINISNGVNPLVHSRQTVGWGIETLFPYGDKLFIGANNGMYIYDNAVPSTPELITQYQHVTSCDPVVVQGDYAYVTLRSGNNCGGFSNQLEVVNISNLADPYQEAVYPMYNPHGLGIDGNTLFVCDGQAGLKIFDASDVHNISNNLKIQYGNIHALDVIPFNNVLMMIGEDGLFQYDYSDVNDVQLLSIIKTNNNE